MCFLLLSFLGFSSRVDDAAGSKKTKNSLFKINLFLFLGAGYHSIHHTTYRHNYGHYFTYMDGLHGTLVSPKEHAEEEARRNSNGKKNKGE